jgi:hypothetical protein
MSFYMDFVRQHRSMLIIGQTHVGKSEIGTGISAISLAYEFPAVGHDSEHTAI